MTAQDYKLIADCFNKYSSRGSIIQALARSLEKSDPRFDRQRFIDACNGK